MVPAALETFSDGSDYTFTNHELPAPSWNLLEPIAATTVDDDLNHLEPISDDQLNNKTAVEETKSTVNETASEDEEAKKLRQIQMRENIERMRQNKLLGDQRTKLASLEDKIVGRKKIPCMTPNAPHQVTTRLAKQRTAADMPFGYLDDVETSGTQQFARRVLDPEPVLHRAGRVVGDTKPARPGHGR